MFLDLRAAIARVSRRDGKDWGTAFFVEPRNLLVTCTHVAAAAADKDSLVPVDVFPPNSNGIATDPLRLWARWLLADSSPQNAWDISLLELIDPPPTWIKSLPIVAGLPTFVGQQIVSHGFSSVRGQFGDPAVGTVIGMTHDPDTRREVIEIRSGELTSGYSGAPIVDSEGGYVIGVLMATLRPDARDKFKEHTWAIPASVLPSISPRIPFADHPLVAELLRVAVARRPTLLDFAVPTGEVIAVMPPRLRQVDGDQSRTIEVAGLLHLLAEAPYKVASISGVSGSGKSTLFRVVLGKGLAEKTLLEAGERIPLYLRATSLVDAQGGTSINQLCRAVATDGVIRYSAASIASNLERLIETSQYKFVMFVDGLDEITDPMLRAEMARNLNDLGERLSKLNHILMVASRPVDELKQLSPPTRRAIEVRMEAASDADREKFFSQLLGNDAPEFSAQYSRIHGIGIQGSPLLATLAVSLFLQRRSLPGSVIGLFHQYVDLLAWRAFGGNQAGAFESAAAAELLEAIQTLAFRSLSVQELTHEDSLQCLQAELARSQPQTFLRLALRHTATVQLEAIASTHLALYRERNALRWTHLSIRDYFAGAYISDRFQNSEHWHATLKNWRDTNWRGAVTFAILIHGTKFALSQEALSAIPPFNDAPPDYEAISFLCNLLELQVESESGLVADIVDAAVVCGIDTIGQYNSCAMLFNSFRHPLDCLIRLQRSIPQAKARILEVINMPNLPPKIRLELVSKLVKHDS